ncbi:GNAT family N-acetyltransferase [Streptococcus gallolyticus]|nr:GNAT family N-acetyltransferase [Streptococcus gallolyticus]MBY5041746.1 GNAT family N-acetyltransferase [Streptococcus gallolyticus]
MIKLKTVDESNFEAVLDLSLSLQDHRRVASNTYSLAQAWLYGEKVKPYAIYNSDQVVGFLMLWIYPEKNEWLIWRLMIDRHHQNQGYGKEVLRQVIKLAQADQVCQRLIADYVIGNHRMRGMLESLAFETKGPVGNEVVMELKIK